MKHAVYIHSVKCEEGTATANKLIGQGSEFCSIDPIAAKTSRRKEKEACLRYFIKLEDLYGFAADYCVGVGTTAKHVG